MLARATIPLFYDRGISSTMVLEGAKAGRLTLFAVDSNVDSIHSQARTRGTIWGCSGLLEHSVYVSLVSHFDLAKHGGSGQAFDYYTSKRRRTRRGTRGEQTGGTDG